MRRYTFNYEEHKKLTKELFDKTIQTLMMHLDSRDSFGQPISNKDHYENTVKLFERLLCEIRELGIIETHEIDND